MNLGELWRYRERMYFLVWRDAKAKYNRRRMPGPDPRGQHCDRRPPVLLRRRLFPNDGDDGLSGPVRQRALPYAASPLPGSALHPGMVFFPE
jgi:hypothetical protein